MAIDSIDPQLRNTKSEQTVVWIEESYSENFFVFKLNQIHYFRVLFVLRLFELFYQLNLQLFCVRSTYSSSEDDEEVTAFGSTKSLLSISISAISMHEFYLKI